MTELKKIKTIDELQEWVEENADGILPDDDFRWWQCSQCYHHCNHNGHHHRDMLRQPVEMDGTLAFVLRDLAVEKGNVYEMYVLTSHLHDIWLSIDNKHYDFETWIVFYVEPWQMIKAACLVLMEKK